MIFSGFTWFKERLSWWSAILFAVSLTTLLVSQTRLMASNTTMITEWNTGKEIWKGQSWPSLVCHPHTLSGGAYKKREREREQTNSRFRVWYLKTTTTRIWRTMLIHSMTMFVLEVCCEHISDSSEFIKRHVLTDQSNDSHPVIHTSCTTELIMFLHDRTGYDASREN